MQLTNIQEVLPRGRPPERTLSKENFIQGGCLPKGGETYEDQQKHTKTGPKLNQDFENTHLRFPSTQGGLVWPWSFAVTRRPASAREWRPRRAATNYTPHLFKSPGGVLGGGVLHAEVPNERVLHG